MRNKSIKKHIIAVSLMIVLIPILIIGIFSCLSNQYSATTLAAKSIEQSAYLAAQRVQWELDSYIILTKETGCNTELANANTSEKRRQDIVNLKVFQYGLESGCAINNEGIGTDGTDYSNSDFFINAMNGNTTVTEPAFVSSAGKTSVIIAAPVWDKGIAGKKAVGCVFFVTKEDFINNIVRDLSISENSTAYVLGKTGTVIAGSDTEAFSEQQNLIECADEYPEYSELIASHRKMISGEQGAETIKLNGMSTIIGYASISETDGWSFGVCAPASDFLTVASVCILITIILVISAAIFSILNSARMGKEVGDPIALCTKRLKLLSEGDLSSPVPEIKTEDETRILADATERLVNDMNSIIGDIGRMLSSMAGGDFNVCSSCEDGVYKGDFSILIESVNEINKKLSNTISQINISADQVSNGSEQVSGGAQILSYGTLKQASSIEQLSSTIHTISDKASDTAEHCITGKRLTEESVEYIGEATQYMCKLKEAMQDISDTSGEISRIIKSIEEIAFQTNILALNAAVEAARAGFSGKGFAVVADEVRNLASKTSDAAQETTVLIERSIDAVKNGTGITAQTARAVSNVESRFNEVRSIVAEIAEASTVQTHMIFQVTQGIEQIADVIQTNSATAEESAAASKELSNQALILKKMVGGFKLR